MESRLTKLTTTAICSLVSIHLFTLSCMADDWRGWMGDSRDGVYRETGIIDEIPKNGLPVKWRIPVYSGYSGPAAADGRVFVFDYQQTSGEAFNNPGQRAELTGKERLVALDADSGKTLWTHAYDCPYSVSYPNGPRCTPTLDGDFVYTLGSEGDLKCLTVSDGKVVWSRSLKQDFNSSSKNGSRVEFETGVCPDVPPSRFFNFCGGRRRSKGPRTAVRNPPHR